MLDYDPTRRIPPHLVLHPIIRTRTSNPFPPCIASNHTNPHVESLPTLYCIQSLPTFFSPLVGVKWPITSFPSKHFPSCIQHPISSPPFPPSIASNPFPSFPSSRGPVGSRAVGPDSENLGSRSRDLGFLSPQGTPLVTVTRTSKQTRNSYHI